MSSSDGDDPARGRYQQENTSRKRRAIDYLDYAWCPLCGRSICQPSRSGTGHEDPRNYITENGEF